jgi:hypothetical protein
MRSRSVTCLLYDEYMNRITTVLALLLEPWSSTELIWNRHAMRPFQYWDNRGSFLWEISSPWWLWYVSQVSILCIISTTFRITKPPSAPLATYVGLFAFCTPACSTPWQRVGVSIIPLRTSLLVFHRSIICVEIDDTNLPYGYRFCFRFFTIFTPCRLHSLTTGWGIHYRSSDVITSIY